MSKKDKPKRRSGSRTHKTWYCEAHDATNEYFDGIKILYGCTCPGPFLKKKTLKDKLVETDYRKITIPIRLLIREHENLKSKIIGLLYYIKKINKKKKKLAKQLLAAGKRIRELKELLKPSEH